MVIMNAPSGRKSEVVVRVDLAEIDQATAPLFARQLRDHEPVDGRLVVDLSDVSFLDSSGVAVLVQRREELAATGATLVVTGLQRPVRRTLEVLGLDRLLTRG